MAKDKKKRDSQLVIRIHKEERDAFVEGDTPSCHQQITADCQLVK